MKSRHMKAQTEIFERVILFGIGVAIFAVCFFVFVGYQDYFFAVSLEDQLDDVGNHISSQIIRLAEKRNESEASIKVDIPQMVGNEPYFITLSSKGLNITTGVTSQTRFFRLYGINNSFNLGGERALSTGGEIMIYKKVDSIIIV